PMPSGGLPPAGCGRVAHPHASAELIFENEFRKAEEFSIIKFNSAGPLGRLNNEAELKIALQILKIMLIYSCYGIL
ncbi:MAG: hypothetical protein IKT27_00310, partial [Clostridia bacterium]|nr:hypothetical protein [Clostridia bacterium]